MSSVVLKNKSPYEILNKKPPTYLSLKAFGCLCFASTTDVNRNKLDPRARKCVFIGFKPGMKGYVLLDIKSREIFISRNVMFYENIFPCNVSNSSEHDQNVEFLEPNSLHNDVPNNYVSHKDHNIIDNDDENSNTDNDITDFSSESERKEDITENHDQINVQPEHD